MEGSGSRLISGPRPHDKKGKPGGPGLPCSVVWLHYCRLAAGHLHAHQGAAHGRFGLVKDLEVGTYTPVRQGRLYKHCLLC